MPNLPPGFEIEDRGDYDPLAPLLQAGVEPTNGYRTKGDIQRLKAEGYTPATNSDHLRGDAVDLTPGKSGWNLTKLAAKAKEVFGPEAQVGIHNGTHVHVSLKGWGQAPGTPGTKYSGLPDVPEGFEVEQRGSLKGANYGSSKLPAVPEGFEVEQPHAADAVPHDGDTFKLDNGRSARLFGVDAYELHQQGRRPDQSLEPLGIEARDFLGRHPPQNIELTGQSSYGRSVVADDPASLGLLRNGYALAEPHYLEGDSRFPSYMEAERLARLNRLGGHGTNAETPAQFRHHDGPWKSAEPGKYGQGEAVFWDDPTPFQGLRDDVAKGYLSVWQDMKSKPEDLLAYAKDNGFKISESDTRKAYAHRNKVGHGDAILSYTNPPRLLTDAGDGASGAAVRGLADPINILDELGGIADTLLPVQDVDGPRENIYNSDRRFGDILWNNIDQNRAILDYDQENHPYARLGGQLGSALITPSVALEGVAARAAEKAIAEGASQFAAEQIGKKALAQRLAQVGAVEGGVAGFGGGEGNPLQRLPGAAEGAIAGAVAGPVLGKAAEGVAELASSQPARKAVRTFKDMLADEVGSVPSGYDPDAPRPRDVLDVSGHPRITPGTPEQRELAAQVQPQDAISPAAFDDSTVYYHQTDAVAAAAIKREGFDLNRLGARGSDSEVPDGVFFKPDERDIGLGGDNGAHVGAHLRMGKTLRVVDREHLKLHLIQDDEYRALHSESERFDYDQAAEFDALDKRWSELARGKGSDEERRAVEAEMDDYLERWKAGNLERSTAARARATKVLKQQGYDSVAIDHDKGSWGRATKTIVVLSPEQVRVIGGAGPLSKIAKAGNINLSRIETPEDIDALMRFTADTFDGFKGERRGVQSWAETEALAKDLGMTPDDLLARRTGEAFNAEQAHAARGILAASAAETRKLADAAINGSEEDKAAFVKSFLLHAAITEKASGAAAEAGRALNIYRKVAKAGLGDREAMQNVVRRMQGGSTPEQVAAMVKELADDPTALNKFARDAIKPRFRDKLMFVWINALLSGPKTHVVNMTSNLLTAAMSLPEHAIAAGIGKLHSGDKVLLSELGPRFYGMIRGGAESLSAAREAFAVGEAGGKVESVRPAIGGTAGRIISIPTRALNAEDVFFKSMARRSELMGLAVRKARSEGLKGDELNARIESLVNNPTEQMIQASNDAALYKTFQRPLGPAGQKITAAIEAWGWPKLFVPFIRTPTNLLKYAVEHSPAAPLLKEVRNDFAAGGAKRDLAVARMVMGTGIASAVAGLAANGHITGGGPADPSAKQALLADGWQPYSFKVGNEYISYRRLDPWSTVIGMAADSVELQSAMTEKQQQDAGAVVVGAMVQNLSNKTWLSGFSDLIDAITDPTRNAKNVITRLGSSMVTPTVLAQGAQATDTTLRDTNGDGYIDTLRKKIEARTPGLSKNLIPRRDIFGNEVQAEGGALFRSLSPFDVKTARNDPDAQAILESGARISVPQRTYKGGRLPDDMFDTYQSYAGQLTKQYIANVRTSPDWVAMDRAAKAKAIEKAKDAARKDARSALFQ